MLAVIVIATAVTGQSAGNSGSINGSVVAPTGAVVPNATVKVHNPASRFDRSTATDAAGKFAVTNIPFNPYHLTVTAGGISSYPQDMEPRPAVPVGMTIKLQVAVSTTQ